MFAFHRFGDGSLRALVVLQDVVAVEFSGAAKVAIAIKLRGGGFVDVDTASAEEIAAFVAALQTLHQQEP